jgi:O-antigen/teichoic acid export membrane protein
VTSAAPEAPEVAVKKSRFRGMALRLGWGLADQAVSSLSNFAMTIYAARSLTAAQFGAFSLAYVTYSFALNASRGLATDPLMVRFNGARRPAWLQAVAGSSGTAALAGFVSGTLVLSMVAFLGSTARGAFLALGLVLPGLLLQDSWRYAFFAVGRGNQALLNDTIWLLAMVPGIGYLRLTGHVNAFSFILIWGLAAAVAASVGPVQTRVLPRLSAAPRWLSSHRDLGLRYLAENASNSGSSQLRSYGVGIMVGLAAVGYVQAATTLSGPFLVVFMGLSLVTIPEAARVLRRSPQHLALFCLVVGGCLAVGGLAWGGFLLVALPKGLGQWLLGPIWRPTYGLVLPLTISVMGACFIGGATAGLHALGVAKRSLRAMVISSAVYLTCGLAGAAWDGAVGTMCGAAVATWVGAVLWWGQLHAALRDAGIPIGGKSATLSVGRHRLAETPESRTRRGTGIRGQRHLGGTSSQLRSDEGEGASNA